MKPAPQSACPLPPLHDGNRLTQKEFHRRYEAYPEHVKAELIGGVVYMASPQRRPHSVRHPLVSFVLVTYAGATPGVEVLDNATAILSEESEPQPDLALHILPEYGGRTREDEDQFLHGAAELLVEVSHSSLPTDLGAKRDDYQRAGASEYLVVAVAQRELHWFDFRSGRPIRGFRGGIHRSRVFPGLWLDAVALFSGNIPRLTEVVQQGVASRPYAAFVNRLAQAHRRLAGRDPES